MFCDGRYAGAALDRNGFHPARIVRTAAGLIAVASEVGILASDEHEIVDRGRLGPGEIVMVDLRRGVVMGTNEIRRKLAYRRRYRQMVDDIVRPLSAADLRRHEERLLHPADLGRSEDRPLHEGDRPYRGSPRST